MIEDTMFDNDCYAVFMEEEHEKEKRVRDNISRQAAIEWCLEGLNNMPSAEPEIVRCKDCNNSEHWYRDRRRCFLWSEDGVSVFDDGFCNYAERRTDG